MYYFIVPRNERIGLKELRVSKIAYTFGYDGPISGIFWKGTPIENHYFTSKTEAWATIEKAAPQYYP